MDQSLQLVCLKDFHGYNQWSSAHQLDKLNIWTFEQGNKLNRVLFGGWKNNAHTPIIGALGQSMYWIEELNKKKQDHLEMLQHVKIVALRGVLHLCYIHVCIRVFFKFSFCLFVCLLAFFYLNDWLFCYQIVCCFFVGFCVCCTCLFVCCICWFVSLLYSSVCLFVCLFYCLLYNCWNKNLLQKLPLHWIKKVPNQR